MNIADYPNPDLSIEVDISPPRIDRAGIYAALRVTEIWRFDGENEQVIIERLSDDGSYHAVDESGFLPIRAEEVRRWVVEEDSDDEAAWAERLRAWVAAELAPTKCSLISRDSLSSRARIRRTRDRPSACGLEAGTTTP